MEKFNQSLLAKQASRIWQNPDSLLGRIMKHKYFPRSSFLECGLGTRPSYAWRSIIHGRELLAQSLLKKIGDGAETRVWTDKWIMDEAPRAPQYKQDAIVDLTITVADLIDPQRNTWNSRVLSELIVDEDVRIIQSSCLNVRVPDSIVWGFSKNGRYDTRSGYKALETFQEIQAPGTFTLPPLEKRLWGDLWKTKTSPKLRHFLWRALSGALAVKERIRSRGINVDTTCLQCGLHEESICHVLFNCEMAKETWERSQIPLPQSGFSSTSVLLNLHHLMRVSKDKKLDYETRARFPWILWHLWKARNTLCFEQTRVDSSVILTKAIEESRIWFLIQNKDNSMNSNVPIGRGKQMWSKPPIGFIKCNVGSSWIPTHMHSGGSWIVRDFRGDTYGTQPSSLHRHSIQAGS